MPRRCCCAIQVDLDTVGVLSRFFGLSDIAQNDRKGCAEAALHALDNFRRLFNENDVSATLFVVGQDLEGTNYRELIRRMFLEGHEIANHTYGHPLQLTGLARGRRLDEIVSCHEAIIRATDAAPLGFRAPGYHVDHETINLLEDAGYRYDASVLPSPLVLFMKCFHLVAGRRGAGRNTLRAGPGSLTHILAPREPYFPSPHDETKPIGRRSIVEVPVATSPCLRIPLHSTVLLPLPTRLASFLRSHPVRDPFTTFAFHLVDLWDPRDIPGSLARRHPMTGMPLDRKWRRCRFILDLLKKEYDLMTTLDMVKRWIDQGHGL